jgi:integrase/recombinase XerD
MTIKEAFAEFVAEYEYRGCTERTIGFYKEQLRFFLKDTKITYLEELTETTIRSWLIARRHLSPNTLQTYDKGLRVICRWFHNRGYLPEFPMAKLPKPRGKTQEIAVFTSEDIKAMLANTDERREGCRDKALILLLLDTGMRIGEAHSLTLKSINWVEGLLTVDGKTGVRSIPFGTRSKRVLKTYIDTERRALNPRITQVFLTNQGTPSTVVTLSRRISKIAQAADVKSTKRGPHTFRHTFAVEYIRAGGDVFSLQKILGHSTLDMTRQYVHLAQSDIREAHRKFSPVSRML